MLSDLKFAMRSLLKTPGFTLLAALTLAIGIGATTAMFSLVNAELLRPLPYAEPAGLARIYTEIQTPDGVQPRFRAATNEYFALRRDSQSWASLDAWNASAANVVTGSEPLRVNAAAVTGGLIETLGVQPVLGRLLVPQDDELGGPLVALISYRFWQSAFGGDPAVVGRDVVLNGARHTIIGVMPERFAFPIGESFTVDVWAPMRIDPALPVYDHSVWMLGRLKPGVSLPQAQAELDALVAHDDVGSAFHHLDPIGHRALAYGLRDEVVREVRPALGMLFGAVSFLLLIACVNVANLLLTRAEARQREIGVRSALGADLRRLARAFATEGVLLSLLGAGLGVLLANAALAAIAATGVVEIPLATDAGVDGRVLLFAVATALATGLVFGFAPLAHVAKHKNLHDVIRAAGTATTAGPARQHLRHSLIVAQLALALILLAGTGLMLQTFWNLARVDSGFDVRSVTTMSVWLRQQGYDGEAARTFWTRLLERAAAIPGVQSVAMSSALPPLSNDFGWGTIIEGFVPVEGGPILPGRGPGGELMGMIDHYLLVSPGYFDALRIKLVAGRLFDARDDARGAKAVIVNETFARAVWGEASALGKHIVPAFSPTHDDPFTVVGVISDVKNGGIEKPTGTALYLPYTQVPATTGLLRAPYVAVRTAGAPDAIARAMRAAVRDVDPTLPVAEIRSLDDVVAASQSRPRFMTLVLTSFGGVSLLLAAVGIFGVISYSVAQRTRELGIRIALGAQARGVLGLVLGGALRLVVAGVLFGLVGALALTRFLSAFLFGVKANDPATLAVVALGLAVVALLASYLPALRATRVDPLAALRTE